MRKTLLEFLVPFLVVAMLASLWAVAQAKCLTEQANQHYYPPLPMVQPPNAEMIAAR